MEPKYKKIKVSRPHCPKCDEDLLGNNSMALPWRCSCGIWEPILYPFEGKYKIKQINN